MNVAETNASALAVARMRKIKNALTAILCGAVPAALLGKLFPTSPVHWRIHMGGWLPSWLRFGREHHLIHHDRPAGRYNVFLPLFDWLLGTAKD